MSRHTFLISADFVLMTSPWQMRNEWGLKQNKECLTQLAPLLKTETNILVCMTTWGWARFTCVKSKFSNEYFITFARGNFRVKLPSNPIIFFSVLLAPLNERPKKILPRLFKTNTHFGILTLIQTIELVSYKYRTRLETSN